MSIQIPIWIIPVLITLMSILVAYLKTPPPENGGYFPDVTPLIVFGYNLIIALLVSLVSWVAYAFLG